MLALFGLEPEKMVRSAAALPGFWASYRQFVRCHRMADPTFELGKLYPCLNDAKTTNGVLSDYFHQDLLVAQRIFERRPTRHADVGSRVDGFVAHLAVFREVEVFDIRPIGGKINNVRFHQLDIMSHLGDKWFGAFDSVSCLHALEHFGLGRYGDPIDYFGYLKGFAALSNLTSPGGRLYLSVPLGPQRIEFNAHRVFSLDYLQQMCAQNFDIEEFSYIDDEGGLHESVALDCDAARVNFGCRYGVAILDMVKK